MDGWEWLRFENELSIVGLNNISEFFTSLLGQLFQDLILVLSVYDRWGFLKSFCLGSKGLELTGFEDSVNVGTEEVSFTLEGFGSLWLEGDGDKVFGRGDSEEEGDGSRFEHLVNLII